MKVIEHAESFEVQTDAGETVARFPFDDHPGRRAISGAVKKKQALQDARARAGKGHTMIPRSP